MIFSVFRQVFKDKRYLLLSAIVTVFIFVLSTWLANLKLVITILFSSAGNIAEKMGILLNLIGSIRTNFTVFSGSYTIILAILFGLNISLVTYYIKRQKTFIKRNGMATSAGGLVSGMLGIGCAACGTVALGPLLSLFGASALLTIMPFGGEEFGILGVLIISLSIYLTAKKIYEPESCRVKII